MFMYYYTVNGVLLENALKTALFSYAKVFEDIV